VNGLKDGTFRENNVLLAAEAIYGTHNREYVLNQLHKIKN
jgi:hypothetical protein